jgi:hypothetical protein
MAITERLVQTIEHLIGHAPLPIEDQSPFRQCEQHVERIYSSIGHGIVRIPSGELPKVRQPNNDDKLKPAA